MPKLKPSLGEITIKTAHQSFRKFIVDELENLRAWNPRLITRIGNRWLFKDIDKIGDYSWTITTIETGFVCKSDMPKVCLSHGITIWMSSGKIEIR